MTKHGARWARVGLRLLLAAWALGTALEVAGESLSEGPCQAVTVQVLNGKSGKPLAQARMTLIAGYTEQDLEQRLWHDEVMADAEGNAVVPRVLVDFPFLRVRVARTKLCQEATRGETYSLGRIRNEGLSAPNHCGFVTRANTPGVLVLFARGNARLAAGAPATEVRADYATDANPEPEAAPNELSQGLAGNRDAVSRPFGRALANVAAAVGSHALEVGRGWAVVRGRDEINALLAWQSDRAEPVTPDHRGTAEPAASYEEMCQPEE